MTIAEKKQRAAIDQAMTQAAADIKDRQAGLTVSFDWDAYDAIDWATIGRDRVDYYANELNTIASLAEGINRLCADADYKEAFSAFTTIVFRSTNDDSIRLRARISGTTMTIDNYTFGSTRQPGDYEAAIRAVL